MNRSVDILNELNEISPLLAGIGNANVFTVPDGYFNSVPDSVLFSVNTANNPAQSDVPEDYFEHLPGNILARIKGTTAHELSTVSPLLAAIKKDHPFTVPENYFEQLPAEILAAVEADEIPAILQNARHLQPYTIPPQYFENLAADILQKLRQQNMPKVVAMPNRRMNILKFAAAAVFTGAVVLGVYKFSADQPINTNNTTAASGIDSVTKKGMTIAADDKKFDETLGSLDEESISKYLEKNASESDMALLTSGIDESMLPEQDEYLTDEKTLDNFIEEISLKN